MLRLISCLLLLVGLRGNAQLWNKTYIEDRPILLFSSVEEKNGHYTVIGGTYGSINNIGKVWLADINNNGEVQSYSIHNDSIYASFAVLTNSFIKTTDNGYAFVGYSYDSTGYLLFGKANGTLDTVDICRYYTPNTYAYHGYSLTQADGYYYIAGVHTTNTPANADVVLVKMDSAGNRLWEKYYGTIYSESAKSIIRLANGNLMLGAVRNDLNQTNQKANTWLIEVDTGGLIVRQWLDTGNNTYAAEGLKQTPDGGFIYGAQKRVFMSGGTAYCHGSVVKLDSMFNKRWSYVGGNLGSTTGFVDLELLLDRGVIACGKYDYGRAWIVKVDSAGNLAWDRKYSVYVNANSQNILTDIDVLPDGSLIAVGQCQNPGQTPPQVGWFLKLDSNGCEIENCTVGIEPTPKSPSRNNRDEKGDLNSRIQVWPNPFSTDLSLTLSEGEGIIPNATFTITNTTGQVVYRQQESDLATGYTKMLDLSYLPNGVYFVAVSTAAGKAVQRLVKE
jgi:hypothetical protein